MKKKIVSVLLVTAMCVGLVAGCGAKGSGSGSDSAKSGDNVLEFYHGYYQDESEWAAAQVMRDIYDDFAAEHADGEVTFKPIAVENRDEIISTKTAGGSFPDLVDCGTALSQAAVAQGLVYDLKPYIDENNLQDAVGINYTQNDVDGHIYTVHDQLESRGFWYNEAVLKAAGATTPDQWTTWDDFAAAMDKVRASGNGEYGYAAGQGSMYIMNAMLGATDEGKALLDGELTEDKINSDALAEAFKAVAAYDQANGSDHTTDDVGNLMDDFNKNGKAAVLFNGVWNASGIAEELTGDVKPAIFPGNVSVSSAGAGLAIAAGMSDAKTELALEFVKYMTSEEVQAKIFSGVQANPCNTTLDLNALASESGDANAVTLATACSQVNEAENVVPDITYVWGDDVKGAMINALMECAVSGTDIDARYGQLQKELLALIG